MCGQADPISGMDIPRSSVGMQVPQTEHALPVEPSANLRIGRIYDQMAGFDSDDFTSDRNLHFGYWDTPNDTHSLEHARERITEVMIEKLRPLRTARVLDVGCGMGTPAIRLADVTNGEIVGITVSRQQVKGANARAAAAGLSNRVSFMYADAATLPFPENSFDAAWALESIIHMPDRVKVLSEIARVIRPGGRVVLTDFFERAPIPESKRPAVARFYRNWVMGPMVRIDDYPSLIRSAGLRLVELSDISDHVMRRTLEEFTRHVSCNRQRNDTILGADVARDLDFSDLRGVWELGYLLAVAELPADT